ncbi:phosphatidylglycerophosphatase and protein-tyrosine phosphatase 1-like [Vanessa atalanta]|uniref:phosphatidylglycerophosphatase and protein-tyrosine phosphatase 1-like n=1 Tax=Vanessa atalanta TaxID=42275 RepID=UPI001FCCD730|nr:phosphatidylglycerophosphatase and protein-tyrosine phosphatase 1-like [Vanessa atalanta]XP_047540165.1 phosphatidylglycerophosphatase and protein-tyrosine phosphatase 1-like [Vanessa atalanta]XP_047540166.1 phosphatidylglycerophosphatase and protein-tyrosine phosphatase 1-like [Vanessa atalanta]
MSTIRNRTNVKLAKLFYKYAERTDHEEETKDEYNESIEADEDSYPPFNFSWFIENKIAAMGCPQKVANLNYLADVGITHIITLSPERIPPLMFCKRRLKCTKIPIKEFGAPTMKQIIKFIELCKKAEITGEIIGVHCQNGHARTGTMLACYLVFFKNMTPERALLTVRVKRPGSCEAYAQEMVCHYHDCIRGTITKPDYRLVDDKLYFDFSMKHSYPDEESLTNLSDEIPFVKVETFKDKLYKDAEFIKKVDKVEAEKKKRMKTMVINHKIYF